MSWGRTTKKSIHTSQVEKWQRRDKLAKWIPLVYPLIMLVTLNLPATLNELSNSDNTTSGILLLLGFYVLMNCIISIPMMFIYRSVSKTAKKAAARNATFQITEDFDYYREKLSDLTPANISLLMDLEIEPDKDIAASILRLTMMGVLSQDGEVIDRNKLALTESDKILIDALEHNCLKKEELSKWKKAAENETLQSGYVEKSTMNVANYGCLLNFMQYVVLLAFIIWLGFGSPIMGWMENIIIQMEAVVTQMEAESEITHNQSSDLDILLAEPILFTQAIFAIMSLGILIVYWFALPIITIIQAVTVGKHAKPFKRTPEGEIATEKIAGMKNFLHDFSNLSDAEKAQLVLWDDFLVYAVVLEENRRIVAEILHMKGLTYHEVKFV